MNTRYIDENVLTDLNYELLDKLLAYDYPETLLQYRVLKYHLDKDHIKDQSMRWVTIRTLKLTEEYLRKYQ